MQPPNPQALWQPASDGGSQLEAFATTTAARRGVPVPDYPQLWKWSVSDPAGFWGAWWQELAIPYDGDPRTVLASTAMPGAAWFPDVRLNYAEAVLAMPGRADADVVVRATSQTRPDVELTAAELRDAVARARAGLLRAGVGTGDRVAAYAPNIPETLVLMLAAASLGAVFSSCPPEFGPSSVLDRWRQLEPTLLLAVDGYRYGAKPVSREAAVAEVLAGLPSIRSVVWLPYLDPDAEGPDGAIPWSSFVGEPAAPAFTRLPFDAPLVVLFSSGTTGLPKAIVHGHGGIVVEHLKAHRLHLDLGAGDRFLWFTTTGWMMWNFLASALGAGTTIGLVDGDPAYPGPAALWELADRWQLTALGLSPAFLAQCRDAGVVPGEVGALDGLRLVGVTGAPLSAELHTWAARNVPDRVQVVPISGGTDVCTAFLGGAPTVPVRAGEIPCAWLGCAVAAWDDDGNSLTDEVGELVVTAPMPSMPVGFWGDAGGDRYRSAYFAERPGVWTHGDLVTTTAAGGWVVHGRSDATLNRHGVRIGTAEFYAVLDEESAVGDSLVVHLEAGAGRADALVLLVADPPSGRLADDDLGRVVDELARRLSPRHRPDRVIHLAHLPRTLSGKRLEVPVKRILGGADPDLCLDRGSVTHPDAVDEIARHAITDAREQAPSGPGPKRVPS
ncbi:acetoacetate--CoA ligase [Nocardioides marmoriginsengisoli]|uniref:Acetoacetate--CoA ligase n=1 Tax=Nocardioides marmoriginsengisoli TaxID=661483 RepID=A0A3N0CHN1_9ACTN|nr:acetoacetate--CoA ligase [Nocardioides marmoriginsengisoli]RNL62526.1 acetoacetate--CoA ligase [Nocardioides marmoriginsengisoli]